MESMGKKVADDPGVVGIIFVPTEVMLGLEGDLRRLAQPSFPIQVALVHLGINRVSPFAVLVVSTIRTLSPNQRSKFARLNPFGGFVILGIGAALRADLENFPCP